MKLEGRLWVPAGTFIPHNNRNALGIGSVPISGRVPTDDSPEFSGRGIPRQGIGWCGTDGLPVDVDRYGVVSGPRASLGW